MKTHDEKAVWRSELHRITELVERDRLSYFEILWNVQNAWLMFASEHRLPEMVESRIEQAFRSRPPFWSTAEEITWIFDLDNKTVRKFLESEEMQRLIKAIKEKENR